MARIHVFTGNYGSGKTETAIRLALNSVKSGKPTALVDLDIVNPYFRSSAKRELLEKAGIKVYCPNFANSSLDVPSLPAEILAVFEDKSLEVFFDVGGDATGAAALGRYHAFFEREGYELLYVVNACRPMSSEPEQITDLLARIEFVSQLKVTGLVNNTNLAAETTAEVLEEGQEVVDRVTETLGIETKLLCGKEDVLSALREELKERFRGKTLIQSPVMRPEWLDE